MFKGLVSVIMPCYNSAAFISESINSVICQSYEKFELIIIDNGSTDETVNIAKQYAVYDPRIKVLTETRKGASYSRNTGIKASMGQYLAFLDSDDLWLPQKLELQVNLVQETGEQLVCSSYLKIDNSGQHIGGFSLTNEEVTRSSLLKTCSVGCLTVFVDRGCEKRWDCFMPNIEKEDYAFWFDLLDYLSCDHFVVISKPLAKYRVHSNGISRSKVKEIKRQWNVYRKHLKVGLLSSLFYISHYIFYGIKKTYLK